MNNLSELVFKYNYGQRNFQNISVKGECFKHVNLSGANFKDSDFNNSDFNYANLRETNFEGCILRGTNFHKILGHKTIFCFSCLDGVKIDDNRFLCVLTAAEELIVKSRKKRCSSTE